MTARDGGSPSAPPPASRETAFLRRHPLLAAFGVLAGLSLFAAYFPLSAMVTTGLVVMRVSGADSLAVRWGRRAVMAATAWWRSRHHAGAAGSPVTGAPQPSDPGRQASALEPSLGHPVASAPAPSPPAAIKRSRPLRAPRPAHTRTQSGAKAGEPEHEVAGL